MKSIYFKSILLLFFSLSIMAQTDKKISLLHYSNWQTMIDSAQKNNKLILVQCGAEWCLPCKQMEKYSFTDATFQSYALKNLYCYKLDASGFDDINVLNQLKVEKYPTTIFFSKQGKELKRLVGFQSAKNLIIEAEKILHPRKIITPPYKKEPTKVVKK